ncbi:MAG: nucleotidyltransferase family protein, partial [Longimicrobiales bacterium]|nr:nucleotidyltransferase family protein [Longimicrobiales bacterium]
REHLILEAVERVRAAFDAAGIEWLAFKGVALIREGLYRPGERSLADADLLVTPEDATMAVRALEGAGFRPWLPWDPDRLLRLPAFTLHAPSAIGEAEDAAALVATVDLHWSTRYDELLSRERPDRDPLWSGALADAGHPGVEEHFVMIADHFSKHLRVTTHLTGIADLVRLLPRLSDPERLLRAARIRGIERRVARVSDLLVERFGVDPERLRVLPPPLRPTGTPLPAALTPEVLILRHGVPERRTGGLRLRWAMGADPLRDLVGVLFPGRRWLAARHPEASSTLVRRLRHWREVVAWVAGRGVSPLSPNQEFE